MLEGIQDNYTFAQPGIQMKIRQLEELLKRVDLQLHQHIVHHDVQYLQFSFRYTGVSIRNVPNMIFPYWMLDIRLISEYIHKKVRFYRCT